MKNILGVNVLCLKKKKKRTYRLSNAADFKFSVGSSKTQQERSGPGTLTMLHITEDTPPDMLAGAMDLTVHLPNGRTVKMAVERSTPMMDLLVQITTNNHLQLSNYTLQVLGMAPSVEHSDKVLPFKPNTPVGALETQHIKVLPKGKTLPAPKHPPPPGHQPFESTFRLKVHLPRNQLYVTRVSRNVHLEDIMKKVCEEKNLDPAKFELKHPGNLDETLDPSLTLSDYQITEIYLVPKGTSNLSQALSSTDIMTLRKEEERKQMHTKTGGGVFNLIFKRNKSSMSSGSISSDTRSLSPTHSDDSRSVTPPGVLALPIMAPPKREPPERPKPPQRKRRPAPLPPTQPTREEGCQKENGSEEKSSSEVAKDTLDQTHSSTARQTISENGLTICHSRNSSDSSGYHEASILSDHNASLPRTRPKSAFVTTDMHQMALAGGSNLEKMAAHSRSTTSLVTGRKKKAPAPPRPPSINAAVVTVSPSSSLVSAFSENPSPLAASQTIPTLADFPEVQDTTFTSAICNPKPFPRKKIGSSEAVGDIIKLQKCNLESLENTNYKWVISKNSESSDSACHEFLRSNVKPPKPTPRKERTNSINLFSDFSNLEPESKSIETSIDKDLINKKIVEQIIKENLSFEISDTNYCIKNNKETAASDGENKTEILTLDPTIDIIKKKEDTENFSSINFKTHSDSNSGFSIINECLTDQNYLKNSIHKHPVLQPKFMIGAHEINAANSEKLKNRDPSLEEMLCSLEAVSSFAAEESLTNKNQLNNENNNFITPKVNSSNVSVGHIQKSIVKNIFLSTEFLKESKPPEIVGVIPKTLPKNTNYLLENNIDNDTSLCKAEIIDEMYDINQDMFKSIYLEEPTSSITEVFNPINLEDKNNIFPKNLSTSNLKSFESGTSAENTISMKKWSNTEKLHDSSLTYFAVKNDWVTGEEDDTESITSNNNPLDTPYTPPIDNILLDNHIEEENILESTDSGIAQDKPSDMDKITESWMLNTSSINLEENTTDIAEDTPRTDISIQEYTRTKCALENLVDETQNSQKEQVVTNKVLEVNEESVNNIQSKTIESNISKTFISNMDAENEKVVEDQENYYILKQQNNIEIYQQQSTDAAKYENINKPVQGIEKNRSFLLGNKIQKPVKDNKEIKNDSETNKKELVKPTESGKVENRPTSLNLKPEKETDLFEINWQYQLPSPPKAFRDSPTNFSENIDCDTQTATEFKDSVVTQPDLFEKLHHFTTDNASETETLKSDVTSIASEEVLNTLSLENLEKRRSLVYNRELATSLKMNNNSTIQETRETKTLKSSRSSNTNTLPNFKITTYDVPKQKIKVFEDDTIRSNVSNMSNLRKSNLAQSMENVSSIRPNSFSQVHDECKEYSFFRPKSTNFETNSGIHRSESFFTDRSKCRPMVRSQSYLTLNKFRDGRMEKSNSTLDVSELQSIGVMRLIQNRLSTPTSSLENLSQINQSQVPLNSMPTILPLMEERENAILSSINKDSSNKPHEVCQNKEVEETAVSRIHKESKIIQNISEASTVSSSLISDAKLQTEPEKRYHYSGPPTINMVTWSERPKVPVHVREDPDYKLGNHDNVVASKIIVNSSNHRINSNDSVEIRNTRNSHNRDSNFTDVSGNNVVGKIDGSETKTKNLIAKNFENSRFQAPLGYRRPFQNLEKNTVSYTPKQRPYSIAFDSDFDISRVPVVRSVELKKPYRDIYTSVTHINPKNNIETDNCINNNNKADTNFTTIDNLAENDNNKFENKVLRVNSFKTLDNHAPPVVRGFRTPSNPSNRLSWSPSSFTLPPKSKLEHHFTTNQHVPFSQLNLKRTDSNRLLKEDSTENTKTRKLSRDDDSPFNSLPSFNLKTNLNLNTTTINDKINKRNVPQNYIPPPPPAQMAEVSLRKVPHQTVNIQKSPFDAKDMLMESIRSFGGKKGLKSVKS